MTELFANADHNWTPDGTKPPQWVVLELSQKFQSQAEDGTIIGYPQYDSALDDTVTSQYQGAWQRALDQYYLQDTKIFDFWADTHIANHQVSHVQHVLYFATVMAYLAHLDAKDSLILQLAACFHDIGRRNGGIDPTHGRLAVERLYQHYKLAPDGDVAQFAQAFSLQSMVLVNSKSEVPMPELRQNDVHVLLDIIQYHSLDDRQAQADFSQRYNDRAAQRRLRLLGLFKDCDALDRLRFAGNLDVHYLRHRNARCLIARSAVLNGLVQPQDFALV
ncbi:MAG: hypothetical protein LKF36_08430 [Lactobacillus sp.]|nr:hypothetical protein [Lactobacillus sp.]